MAWASNIAELLWHSAWTVIPLALLVAAICRWAPCRPVTRHTLWMIVLLSFLAPLAAPFLPVPELLPRGVDLPAEEQDASAPACQPTVPKLVVKDGYVVVPSSQAPLELLSALANRPQLGPDTADTAVPPRSTTADAAVPHGRDPLVWHGRVGRESAKAEPDGHHSASTGHSASASTDGHPALTQPGPAQPVVLAAEPPGREDARRASTGSAWRAWVVALARLRDALLNLPTLPLRLWLIGIVSLVAVYVGGAIRFRRRLRRAAPAPNAVQRMVVRTARQFELRRAPETLVLDEPISPMVWCGGRVRLVLPAGLWSQLDEVGRQAIVCHELAHLRRRDHWLRWLELLVSVVFWWHPLVWWVRRRVHEEADLCCDAWVTWLMPRRRRAYAEALLAAREHMGAGRRLTPAVAVGVTTSGAKRFARRITMVMTQSSRPGVSLAGIGLAGALLLAGWITTPAWSSPPPDERAVDCKTVVVKGEAASDCCQKSGQKCDTQCRVIVLGGDAAGESEQKCGERKVIVKKLGEEGDDGPFSVFYSMASGDDEDETRYFLQQLGGSDDDELEQRLERLEKAVQQLTELLGGEAVDVDVPAPPAPPCPPAPPGLLKSYTWRTPEGKTFKIGDDEVSIAIGTPWVSVDTGETVVKAYKLPQGKLEALTALMVRQDVPVLVSPKEDCIEVHGTEAQHKIFKAFVDLINPAGKESSAKGEAAPQASIIINGTDLSDLLKSRVDADVLLQHGDKAERQKALDLYRKALSQMGKYQITVPGGDLKVIKELDEESAEQAEQMRKEAQQLRQQAEELREQVEAYQSKTQPGQDELLHAVRELQKEAKKLQKLAEQLSKQAEHEHE